MFTLLLDKYADKCFISGVPHTNICTSLLYYKNNYIHRGKLLKYSQALFFEKKTIDGLSKGIKILQVILLSANKNVELFHLLTPPMFIRLLKFVLHSKLTSSRKVLELLKRL